MKALFSFLLALSLAIGQEKLAIPYKNGVTNFSYSKPFWLVSPATFSDMLAVYGTQTNTKALMSAQDSLIMSLRMQTNLDSRYIALCDLQVKTMKKEASWQDAKVIFGTVGGITIGVGFTALMYYIVSMQVKEVWK